jgi:GWxTD domain-containing protein
MNCEPLTDLGEVSKMKKLYWVAFLLILGCAATNPYLWRLPKETQQMYYVLEPIATDEELKEFLKLGPQERDEWLKVFWKKRDPTPTTEENEFKEEHQRRVEYALENFRSTFGKCPWDDRGEVYIKYGEPDERELRIYKHWDTRKPFSQDLTRDHTEDQTKGWGVSLKQWRKDPEKTEVSDFPEIEERRTEELWSNFGEIWSYYRYRLTLQFEEEHMLGHYTLVPYTDEFGRTQNPQKFSVEKVAKVEAQKEIYAHDYGGEAFDFALNFVKFRSEGKTYDLDVNLGLPLDKMGWGGDESNLVSFMRRIVIWDKNAKQVAFDSTTVTKSVDKNERQGYLLVDQRSYNLDPGQYTLAVEVRDLNTQKIGIYKRDFLIPEYVVPKSQEISEVVMASFIRPAKEGEKKFVRHGLLVMPLPSKVYFTTQPVSFYYEIYNLKKDQQGKSKYYVSYNLIDFKDKRETPLYPSNTFEADTMDVFQVGTLDPAQIGPGEYALAIYVKDLNSEKEKITLTSFKIAR